MNERIPDFPGNQEDAPTVIVEVETLLEDEKSVERNEQIAEIDRRNEEISQEMVDSALNSEKELRQLEEVKGAILEIAGSAERAEAQKKLDKLNDEIAELASERQRILKERSKGGLFSKAKLFVQIMLGNNVKTDDLKKKIESLALEKEELMKGMLENEMVAKQEKSVERNAEYLNERIVNNMKLLGYSLNSEGINAYIEDLPKLLDSKSENKTNIDHLNALLQEAELGNIELSTEQKSIIDESIKELNRQNFRKVIIESAYTMPDANGDKLDYEKILDITKVLARGIEEEDKFVLDNIDELKNYPDIVDVIKENLDSSSSDLVEMDERVRSELMERLDINMDGGNEEVPTVEAPTVEASTVIDLALESEKTPKQEIAELQSLDDMISYITLATKEASDNNRETPLNFSAEKLPEGSETTLKRLIDMKQKIASGQNFISLGDTRITNIYGLAKKLRQILKDENIEILNKKDYQKRIKELENESPRKVA